MFFMDCDEGEISRDEIINALETSKSSDLLIKAVKKASNFLVPHLTKFFDSFIQRGVFPSTLKVGRVTPIFKKTIHNCLETIDLYAHYQYLVKYSEKPYLYMYNL